jgi:ABC-type glycerol-3-phosphate transport system substrate-binding protein
VTWAKELGFNSAPKNADEFREQACKANASYKVGDDTSDDGYGGWAINTDSDTALAWMLAFNGGALDAGGYQFQTDQNLQAFTFVKSLFDKNCAWLSGEENIYNQFALRRALFATASITELSNTLRAFRENSSADQWTVIPFTGDAQTVVTYGPSYAVIKSSKENELAAWLFIKWMLTPENQKRWVENTGYLPLLKSEMPLLKTYSDSHPQWTSAVALLEYAKNYPQRASWRNVKYVLGDAFTDIFRTNIAIDRLNVMLYQLNSMAQEMDK